MARYAVRLNSFGSQSLLSANFKQTRVYDPGPQPRNSLYETIDGALFDAAGSSSNTLVPGQVIECDIVVEATSGANFDTYTAQLLALEGDKATLTGQDATGDTVTCTARCLAVPVTTTSVNHARFWQPYTLYFKTITNWT